MREYKIMIVDDEPDILGLLEKALQIEGFLHIIKAEDGLSAVSTCKQACPDIIILDIMIPKMDGYEVCKHIRQFSHCPILFLSAPYCFCLQKMMNSIKYLAWRWEAMIM